MELVLEYMYSADYKYVSEAEEAIRANANPSSDASLVSSFGRGVLQVRSQTGNPQTSSRAVVILEPLSVTGTGALLAHAKMHVAAEQLQIHGLHTHARSKYHTALLKEAQTRGLVESVKFVFENCKLFKGEYFLRADIVSFIARNYKDFVYSNGYQTL